MAKDISMIYKNTYEPSGSLLPADAADQSPVDVEPAQVPINYKSGFSNQNSESLLQLIDLADTSIHKINFNVEKRKNIIVHLNVNIVGLVCFSLMVQVLLLGGILNGTLYATLSIVSINLVLLLFGVRLGIRSSGSDGQLMYCSHQLLGFKRKAEMHLVSRSLISLDVIDSLESELNSLIIKLPNLGGVSGQMQANKSKSESNPKEKALKAKTFVGETMGDLLDIDEIHLVLSRELVPLAMDEETGLDKRFEKIRKYIVTEYGFILPAVRLTDNAQLQTDTYKIFIQGTEVAKGILKLGCVMSLMEENDHPEIPGTQFLEPVYNASARWVPKVHRGELGKLGVKVVEVEEVLATHLLETLQAHFTKLLTRRSLRTTLNAYKDVRDSARAESNTKILDEFIPDKVPMDTLQGVLRLLLAERVSVRNIPLILETISEVKPKVNSIEQITECVRQRISYQFIEKLRDEQGRLPLVQLDPEWENLFIKHETRQENGNVDIALPPDEFIRLADAVRDKLNESVIKGHYAAVIVTSARRRRFIKMVMSAKGIRNPVISYEEIPANERPVILSVA